MTKSHWQQVDERHAEIGAANVGKAWEHWLFTVDGVVIDGPVKLTVAQVSAVMDSVMRRRILAPAVGYFDEGLNIHRF